MREGPAPAIEPPGLGYRCPERRRRMILLNRCADRARDPNAVPRRAGKRHGVRKPRPDMLVQSINAAAKSARCQHDPSPHRYAAGIAFDQKHGAANATRRDCELLQGWPNRHTVTAQAVKES